MFERFTDRARRAVVLAQEEALAGLGSGRGHPGQGRSSGGLGIDWIRLTLSPPQAAVGPVNLDHLHAVGANKPGQASSVGPGPFHADAFDRSEALRPGHQRDVAAGRGWKAWVARSRPA
jgi:hypothetical protein